MKKPSSEFSSHQNTAKATKQNAFLSQDTSAMKKSTILFSSMPKLSERKRKSWSGTSNEASNSLNLFIQKSTNSTTKLVIRKESTRDGVSFVKRPFSEIGRSQDTRSLAPENIHPQEEQHQHTNFTTNCSL